MASRRAIRTRHVGLLAHVPGLLALLSIPVALLAGEGFAVPGLVVAAGVSLGLGRLLARAAPASAEPDLADAMASAAAAWLVAPVLASLPFLLCGRSESALAAFPEAAVYAHPLNALFEGFSGLTSTGLTMSPRASELPRTLQWWRSLLQWSGGLGVAVWMLAVVRSGAGAVQLFHAEAREEKILPSVRSTVQVILRLYLLFTAGTVAALWAAGSPPWEALNHAMTAVATGGFTIRDDSAAGLPVAVQLVLLGAVVAGATSFAALDQVLRRRRPLLPWREGQHRLLASLLALGAVAMWAQNRLTPPAGEPGPVALASVFQWTSALCTAGFQSVDLAAWSEGARLLLVVAMVLGGAAGSTCGGVKLSRVYLLYKGVVWRFRRIGLSRHELLRHELDGHGIPPQRAVRAVEDAAMLAVAWMAVLLVGTLVLLHHAPPGTPAGSVLLEAASAQGNVGLSSGLTGPDLPAGGKLTLMALMWAGRLEILPAMVLLVPALTRARNGPGRG